MSPRFCGLPLKDKVNSRFFKLSFICRSLDQLDLKDHRDLEEFTKRYYTHGHFATLKPTIAYIGKDQDTMETEEQRCDCHAMHHSRHDLFY